MSAVDFSILREGRASTRAWVAFLTGALLCLLVLAYGEVRRGPSGVLTFDASATRPGLLKVLYTKDGVLVDPGWTVNFPQGNTTKRSSFSLKPGNYELIGFKPLVEAGGNVSIKNLSIISGTGVRDISASSFVGINQLIVLDSQSGGVTVAPAQGATDPFGVFHGLREVVPTKPFALVPFLSVTAGKITLVAVFLALMYGLSGSLPFATREPDSPRSEPALSNFIGLLAVGVIVLYLRNAHSLFVPVLYTEDGTWGAGLIDRGFLDMLFNAKEGHARYFVFGNIILLEFAQLANAAFFGHNLSYLPHFVSFFSILFYSALAVAPVILLRDVLRIEARILLWLLILLVPLGDSTFEVFGRLSNVGFVFLFLAFCLLVWRHYSLQDGSRKAVVATDAMLFLCANTNPLCYPLIGIALGAEALNQRRHTTLSKSDSWINNYLSKFKNKSAIALICLILIMGVWMLIREKGGDSFLGGLIAKRNLIELIIARVLVFPFVFPIYHGLSTFLAALIGLSFVSIIIFCIKRIDQERFVIIYAGITLAVATFATIISRPGLTQILNGYKTTALDRYYFGLTYFSMLLVVSLLSAGFRKQGGSWTNLVANSVSGCLIALYIGSVTYMFELDAARWRDLPNKSFKENVVEAFSRSGEPGPTGIRYQIALHPNPWVTHFPQKFVLSTVLGVNSISFALPDTYFARNATVLSDVASRYEGKVIRQKAAGRGRDDGWFYVANGVRSWIIDSTWLDKKGISPSEVVEITAFEFSQIPDSGRIAD